MISLKSSEVIKSLVLWICLINQINADCYFLPEHQGKYVTQNTVTREEVSYSEIVIASDEINIWGQCYKRINNNVILKMENGEFNCYRCLHLKLVTRNVLRVYTSIDEMSKCNTNEEIAIKSCITPHMLNDPTKHTEIILYKTSDGDGQEIRKQYCPINGRFKLTYNVDDGMEDRIECPKPDSELDTCPSGSAMNLRFKKCSFENHAIRFECLGHWTDHNNKKYLALMNTRAQDKLGPHYRCAIYDEDSTSGIVTVYFSNDSTCASVHNYNFNNNADIAHRETLTLYPIKPKSWPSNEFCSFPKKMLGHWEHMFFEENQNTLVYRDHSSFKTYTMKCESVDAVNPDRFLIFSRTQCGEESYQCIWLKKRSTNIIEFKLGSKSSQVSSSMLCSDEYFENSHWITQGRTLENTIIKNPCPVSGEFKGSLPDVEGICAKLTSNCDSPDYMFYQVSACHNEDIIEEREYRCLGQWTEDNLVYTYTQRLDIGTFECFVGAINSTDEILLKEAGEYCQRSADPLKYGMRLQKSVSCIESKSTTEESSMVVSTERTEDYSVTTTTIRSTTKKLISIKVEKSSANKNQVFLTVLVAGLLVLNYI